MANLDNECSHLKIEDKYSEYTNHLEFLMNLQKHTQEKTYGYDFSKMTLKEVAEFWKWNHLAICDEFMEAFAALGGIKDGIGNGVWKPWKQSNKKTTEMTIDSLSPSDNLELKYEMVDIMHFMFNMMNSIKMTPQELFNLYLSKNLENISRQERGY